MAYHFSTDEITRLQTARLLCPEGDIIPTSTGNWSPFYTELSAIIEEGRKRGRIYF
jgi:hypothetical protein